MKNKLRERGRGDLFCVKKLCIEWKIKCQIYSKMFRIRRVKIKEDKKVKKKNDNKVESNGEIKR